MIGDIIISVVTTIIIVLCAIMLAAPQQCSEIGIWFNREW